MTLEVAAARTPTSSETRAPYSTPVQMSRPKSSVPKGWARLGAASGSSPIARGDEPLSASENRAAPSISARVSAPATAARFRANRRTNEGGCRTATRDGALCGSVAACSITSAVLDARVQDAVHDVHKQVGQDAPDRHQHESADDHGIIAGLQRRKRE